MHTALVKSVNCGRYANTGVFAEDISVLHDGINDVLLSLQSGRAISRVIQPDHKSQTHI